MRISQRRSQLEVEAMSSWRAAATAALMVVGGTFGSGIDAGPGAMRIGGQLPLSGERAAVGRTIKSGVEMAVEAVNREGGVGRVPVEVIYEDDQDTEQGGSETIKKLVQDHRVVAVIGELFSRYVIACREIVEQAGVPYLTGGTSPRTTEQTRGIFRGGAGGGGPGAPPSPPRR